MYKIKRFNCTWNEYKQFSEGDEERAEARKGKELQDSHRGLGRSLILGGPAGAAGAYMTKGKVDEDYAAGKSEKEIVSNASKRGALGGAGIGAGVALGSGLVNYKKNVAALTSLGADRTIAGKITKAAIPIGVAAGAGLGALGGSLGAKKNARTRLRKDREANE